jgi:hypothetical protein
MLTIFLLRNQKKNLIKVVENAFEIQREIISFVNLSSFANNGFSDFVHRPDSKQLEDKNTTFRKLELDLQ